MQLGTPIDLARSEFAERYPTEQAAREFLESMHWPDGAVCPHCGRRNARRVGSVRGRRRGPGGKKMSRPARPGLWYCRGCGDQFTVTEGTIMEHSHIPLDKWLLAIYLLSTIKVGISAHRLHRTLGITYKSAWFLVHRIRYALAQEPFASKMKERGNARLRTLSFPKPGCFEHNVRDLLVVKPSLRPK